MRYFWLLFYFSVFFSFFCCLNEEKLFERQTDNQQIPEHFICAIECCSLIVTSCYKPIARLNVKCFVVKSMTLACLLIIILYQASNCFQPFLLQLRRLVKKCGDLKMKKKMYNKTKYDLAHNYKEKNVYFFCFWSKQEKNDIMLSFQQIKRKKKNNNSTRAMTPFSKLQLLSRFVYVDKWWSSVLSSEFSFSLEIPSYDYNYKYEKQTQMHLN